MEAKEKEIERVKIDIDEEEVEGFFNECLRKIKKLAYELIDIVGANYYEEVLTLAIKNAFHLYVYSVEIGKNLVIRMYFDTWYDFDTFVERYKLNIKRYKYDEAEVAVIYFVNLDLESLYFSYQFLQDIYQELEKMLLEKDEDSPFDIEYLKNNYPGLFKLLVMGRLME